MNTRQPIQPSNTPAVLSLCFSSTRNRFVAGLSDGLRVFRSDNCLTAFRLNRAPHDGGIAIAEVLDDRYLAFVGGGRSPISSPNVMVFWDCLLDQEINRFDFYEPVLGLRLSTHYMIVILEERTVIFEYRELEPQQEPTPSPDMEASTDTMTAEPQPRRGPNAIKACHATSPNTFALACLRNDTLILPAQAIGQVQLIPLAGGSKRVMRVHNSALRSMTLSPDGTVLATASETGTLIRVWDTKTQAQLAEFRRGVDHAIIHDLAISDTNRWLACTSDKGTVHIFDLRPTPPPETTAPRPSMPHRKSHSHPHQPSTQPRPHRLSSGQNDKDSLLSSPTAATRAPQAYQGSIQEYYGLRPPPLPSAPHNSSNSPTATAAAGAFAAFKSSPLAPRIMKDIRSVASTAFYTGDDPPHWQGGTPHSWATAPDGTRKRVKNPVLPLPADPTGRPRKGVLGFVPLEDGDGEEDGGCKFWVVGGGSDARWEVFELVPVQGGATGWGLVRGGFRKYLTRQFVD